MTKFNMGDLLENKPIKKEKLQVKESPKIIKVKKTPVKKPKNNKVKEKVKKIGDKYEPRITWYRSTAELLTGTSCRESKIDSINTIMKELEKKKQEEIERKKQEMLRKSQLNRN